MTILSAKELAEYTALNEANDLTSFGISTLLRMIDTLQGREAKLVAALTEIAQWQNGLSGDHSKSAKFAEMARACLKELE